MKHINYFNEFLENEVNLNKTRVDTLNEKTEIITKYLKNKLEGFESVEKQGSYAMRTIIKPPKDKNFDADIIVYITRKEDFDAKAYIEEIYTLFKNDGNYKDIVSRGSRCITLNYSGDFNLDLVPCIEKGEKKYICNRDTNDFEITDGTGYKRWLTEKDKDSQKYLKQVTRLAKYMRDIKTNFSCKSILLTTLLGNQIDKNDNFDNLPTALKTVFNHLNDFLKKNDKMPTIKNPALPQEEDFNRHWDQTKYSNFKEKIELYTKKLNEAFDTENHNESVKKWREIFGDKFGELKNSSGISESGVAFSFATGANKPYCDKY